MNINYPKIKIIDIRENNEIFRFTEEKLLGIDAICIITNLDFDEHINIVNDILLKHDKDFFIVIIDVNNNKLHANKNDKFKKIYDVIITASENELNECLYVINKLVNPDGLVSIDLSDLKSIVNKSFIGKMYISKNEGFNIGEKCALQILSKLANNYILNNIKKMHNTG